MDKEKIKGLFNEAIETNDTELFMDLGDICHLFAQLTKKLNSVVYEMQNYKIQPQDPSVSDNTAEAE